MRRLSFVVLLVVLASLFALPTGPAHAATFRNHIARVPDTPTSGEAVRVWMQSDTAYGETAFIEYNIVGTNTYVKVEGAFDTSGPAPANWRADIPAQPAGTEVRYQLLTRNEFGSDYGFTGFNWSYTVQGVTGDIRWDEVRHDSFSADYRSPGGPVAIGATVRLRLRVAQGDITGARVRLWDDRTNTESFLPMSWDGAFDTDPVTHDWWAVDVPTGADPTVLYYFFELNDNGDQDFYVDDDPKFYGGGLGAMSDGWDDSRGFQITAYDPAFNVPVWMQRGIVYQIFPDRFRDGNSANNPAAGRFSYGANVSIVRSNDPEGDWNSTVCDPRGQQGAGLNCPDRYGDNFYGGDLAGITEKIADGYLSSLGVTVIYLNPIFRAPSNHKYDTANFLEIDPDFGTLAEFQALVQAANARKIKIMLDGVFNHTSSDSPYFDRYGRYGETGACEATASSPSPYSSWFYFPAFANAGSDGGVQVTCQNGQTYEAWYGYSSLPKLDSSLQQVRDYFYGSPAAVGPYWTNQGASGWRFDVGADVDPGVTNDPANNYWESFRSAVRGRHTSKEDVVMLGEEWGDASSWLLGSEWDSVMNYRFRSAVLSWLFTGCSGNGCSGGTKFQENDSNDNSSSGAISYLSPSQFNARLRSIQEDYPPMAFKAMMNLAGSHDTQRLRFLLKKINGDSDPAAVQRMKEWWLFAFTYAGAPTLYYGDEVGLSHDGVWDGSQFQDDPYNRAPFPWGDTQGAYGADAGLQSFARHMASVRQSYAALQDGDVQHGLVVDDARQLYGFARTNGAQTALVLLNRSGAAHSATFSGLNAAPYNLPDGAVLLDAISGASYTVSGGAVTVSVTPSWGAVLLEPAKVDTPAAPAGLSAAAAGADVALSWQPVSADSGAGPEVATTYEIFRGAAGFTPSAANRIATVAPPQFGGPLSYIDAGAAGGGFTYVVRACNAAGSCADAPPVAVPADPSYSFSGFFAPVDNPPVVNRVNAGRAIPVKFSLGGDFGLEIFAAGYPASQVVSCASGAPTDTVEQTVSAGASSLAYDPATGVYTYVWKTERSWRGCRELVVRFDDGSEQRALFNFR
jgi:glycosidase